MSLTSRLCGMSLTLFNSRHVCRPVIISRAQINKQISNSTRTLYESLHLSNIIQPYCYTATQRSSDLNKRSATFISPQQFCRLFSSQAESDPRGELVYHGRVSKMLRVLKIFSLSTSAIGLAVQPYLWLTYQNMPLITALPFFTVINMFVFVNPILIHFISKKYILDLYFDHDSKIFTAQVLTFFARKETITFTAADVHVPDVPNMFAMLNVRGRPLFAHEPAFTNLNVYKHLMGFDRPLDLTYIVDDKSKSSYLDGKEKDS